MLRLAVNLARFTKTRVCLSCFGSTNSGTRLFSGYGPLNPAASAFYPMVSGPPAMTSRAKRKSGGWGYGKMNPASSRKVREGQKEMKSRKLKQRGVWLRNCLNC